MQNEINIKHTNLDGFIFFEHKQAFKGVQKLTKNGECYVNLTKKEARYCHNHPNFVYFGLENHKKASYKNAVRELHICLTDLRELKQQLELNAKKYADDKWKSRFIAKVLACTEQAIFADEQLFKIFLEKAFTNERRKEHKKHLNN